MKFTIVKVSIALLIIALLPVSRSFALDKGETGRKAVITHPNGDSFRTDDGGATWVKGNVKKDVAVVVSHPDGSQYFSQDGGRTWIATTTHAKPKTPEKIALEIEAETTQVEFSSGSRQKVSICLYDIKGEMVRKIFEGILPEGMHSVPVDTKNLPNGSYFIRIVSPEKTSNQVLNILK